ncbi:hypothetical protein [Tenacibaculum singaporense]|uniref:Uncharacterized protein n=1 Tax=Tenacibaculum singaporense TaxID=2358479 RepID=A0A3Q8RS71_9FLAO|nr:hypothetical protein [Tenacibaculum singaporense]AZJ35945.1 hypothetical protein D6T69_10575 [Tenacibaculum singaporense]RSC93212.1 hypothetical protein EI424_12320 [Tenacibaculum singaporense]
MKKLLLLTGLLFSVASYSQIEFIETTKTEIVGKIEYVYLEKIGDEAYNFYYKNINDPIHEYVHFSFKNLDNDVEKLHQIIVKGFEENPRDPYKIKANGDVIWLKYTKVDGVVMLQIQQYVSRDPDIMTVSKLLTYEEVNKLFSK